MNCLECLAGDTGFACVTPFFSVIDLLSFDRVCKVIHQSLKRPDFSGEVFQCMTWRIDFRKLLRLYTAWPSHVRRLQVVWPNEKESEKDESSELKMLDVLRAQRKAENQTWQLISINWIDENGALRGESIQCIRRRASLEFVAHGLELFGEPVHFVRAAALVWQLSVCPGH